MTGEKHPLFPLRGNGKRRLSSRGEAEGDHHRRGLHALPISISSTWSSVGDDDDDAVFNGHSSMMMRRIRSDGGSLLHSSMRRAHVV
ncbi:hypothetical protein M569_00290 [Genlisea aurea]|uniref:Uncharacterized protein n=1 Tax=Genlisea aurea TaxID=192259 RepID=S8D426_9LAMI|nr:hypothetical protein M569_00290 [Genlisea aurea]